MISNYFYVLQKDVINFKYTLNVLLNVNAMRVLTETNLITLLPNKLIGFLRKKKTVINLSRYITTRAADSEKPLYPYAYIVHLTTIHRLNDMINLGIIARHKPILTLAIVYPYICYIPPTIPKLTARLNVGNHIHMRPSKPNSTEFLCRRTRSRYIYHTPLIS